METINFKVLSLIRRLLLSISIIGFAAACKSKKHENKDYDDNQESSMYSRRVDSGSETSDNSGLVTNTDTKTEEQESPTSMNQETEETEVKTETETETPKENSEEESTTEETKPQTSSQETKTETETTTEEENKPMVNPCCDFKLDDCKGMVNKKRTLREWPKGYTPFIPENNRIECSEDMIRRANTEGNEREEVAQRVREIARILGIAPNKTSDTNCKMRNIYVHYTPFNGKWENGEGPWAQQWWGIVKQARDCIRKNCGNHGARVLQSSDRIAVLSFGVENPTIFNKYVKWRDARMDIIEKINDKDKGLDDVYPKVKLQMYAITTYIYDKSQDKQGTEYTFDKECAELLEFVGDSKQYVTRKGIAVPYKCEKLLKDFTYICPVTQYCAPRSEQKCRDRDALIFFANDAHCGEYGCPFKTIHKMMRKGKAPSQGMLDSRLRRWHTERPRRMIMMTKMTNCGNCKQRECLAVVDFVWRLTIQYKENEKVKTYVHENLIHYPFF